ncbi:MAG: DoxX family protein [Patescibacteria group bacterium]
MNFDTINFVGRIIFGLYFVYSGWQHFKNRQSYAAYAASKKVPMPMFGVLASGALIILGGLGVVFAVHKTLSLLLIIIFLIPVTVFMHNFWADTDPNTKMNNKIGFLKNTALLGAAMMML